MFPKIRDFLHYPLITISGGDITPGSVIVGVVVVFLSAILASIASRWLRTLLGARGLSHGAQFAASKILRYSVVLLGVLVGLSSMGIKLDALIAASTVLAVGIGFGLQNVVQNFISGLVLLIEQPVSKGDFVKVGNAYGVIEDIGLRATQIITRDEVTIIVPNSELIASAVINHSRPTTNLRIQVTVDVSAKCDTALVRDTLLEVGAKHPEVITTLGVEVRLDACNEPAFLFVLLVWIPDPREDLRIASDLRFAIEAAFKEKGIEGPIPERINYHRAGLPRALREN
ncbi:mechanosensitive ion channel family protein [Pendulispora albinea]|uniref:Mechanosensitive ion channel n=1 Tax=Pendulispora albinea TaxID=2741071 RepID=A0ABZ2M988_9BACT